MTREEIQSKVIELAAEQSHVDAAHVTSESHFVNDLHFDSLDAINFQMAVEDEFELSIPDEAGQTLQTVGDAIEYVAERVGTASAS